MQDKGDVLRKDHMDKWKRIFLFTITAILIYFILMTVVTPKRYKLNEGDIATVDIKAPRDIIDEEATNLKEQEVAAKVEKKFTLKNEIKIEASNNVKGFFDKLINLKSNNIDEKSKIAELKKIDTINLSDSEYKELLDLCKKYKVKIILGSDAHICYQVGIFDNAEKLLEEVDFPKELVINYHEDEIKKFFNL